MAIRLTIVDKHNPNKEYERGFVQHKIVVGRTSVCDICLPDMSVSTSHLEIKLEGTEYKAVDLGSLNGTFVGQKKLIAHRPKKLKDGNIINVAGYLINFNVGVSQKSMPHRDEPHHQAQQMLGSILSLSSQEKNGPAILVIGGPSTPARHELPPQPSTVLIGRARDALIKLEDIDVSRQHAEVVYSDNKVLIKDLGSRNGVVVAGKKESSVALAQGDTFVIGNTTLLLENPIDRPLFEIQNAPEEETSSFIPTNLSEVVNRKSTSEQSKITDESASDAKSNTTSKTSKIQPLPIGPADPLDYKRDSDSFAAKHKRATEALEGRSDIGLIFVGAIIIVISVAGLVWLFT